MLPPATEKVWRFLKEHPALAGFVLIGGSGLALRIGHRVSEDLDFAFPHLRLPPPRLDAMRRAAQAAGFDFQRDDHEAAVQDFAVAGMELHDYQQDFLVDGIVKVSFFTPDQTLLKVLAEPPERKARVATLAELFKTKCLVSASRSKTRDWLDLYVLMRHHGFTIRQYQQAFLEAGVAAQCDTGLARLCSGVPQRDDEGYAHLLAAPPQLEEITAFFVAQRNLIEVETAAEAMHRRRAHDPQQQRDP